MTKTYALRSRIDLPGRCANAIFWNCRLLMAVLNGGTPTRVSTNLGNSDVATRNAPAAMGREGALVAVDRGRYFCVVSSAMPIGSIGST